MFGRQQFPWSRNRHGESLREQCDHLSLLSAKQLAAAKLDTRVTQEKQFNRKVALNAQLRELKTEIDQLATN